MRGCRILSQYSPHRKAADTRQVDTHQDHNRPQGAGEFNGLRAVHGGQPAEIGAARDQCLDEHHIGGVVLDIGQGVDLRFYLRINLRGGGVGRHGNR